MAILLIEDYEDDVFLFERALMAVCPGVALHSVSTAETAQCYLRGDGVYGDRESYPLPTIIFLDWFLPKLRGGGFLTWIQSHRQFSDIPVIVLSSDLSREKVPRIVEAGASAVMIKPAQFDELKKALAIACGSWLGCCAGTDDPGNLVHISAKAEPSNPIAL
jgi:DNA-binding response OmpR family regulator